MGSTMGTPKDSLKTRSKIIEAAGQLFTEKGFKGVTVRAIATTAGVHLGALNYHFRTKEALYREVLLEACRIASICEADQESLAGMDPVDALYQIISISLKTLQEQGQSNWQSAILTRECREPGPVFTELADTYFKPQSDFLAKIIGKIVDRPLDSHAVQFAGISMLGLVETCGLYSHYVDAVAPGLLKFGKKEDWFARQITQLVIQAATDDISPNIKPGARLPS